MKTNNTKILLEKIEGKQSVSDKFHSFTNNKILGVKINRKYAPPQSWIKIHFKTYPRLNRIKLNSKIEKNKTGKLSNIIEQRKSFRKFSGLSITKNDLSYLLLYSCGLIRLGKSFDDSRRPYPSAGARYPLEIYPLILKCEEIENGLYHYNVKEHSLELLLKENLSNWLLKTTGGENWMTKASVIFIITGVLDRTRVKYGDRGYRYVLIEAGHVGQNICLLSTDLGLGSCAIGGYIDQEVNKLLDINLQKENTLYMFAVGKL